MQASGPHIPIQQDPVCCAPARVDMTSRAETGTTRVDTARVRPRSGRGPAKGMKLVPGGEFLMGTDDRGGIPVGRRGPNTRSPFGPIFHRCLRRHQCPVRSIRQSHRLQDRGRDLRLVLRFSLPRSAQGSRHGQQSRAGSAVVVACLRGLLASGLKAPAPVW